MDALKIKKAEELFRSAVGLTTEKRVSFLTEQCGDDVALRTFVEELLAHDATGMGDFLCKPAFTAGQDGTAGADGEMPEHIGHYEIVGVLGTGGMGVVYEARQEHPQRTVALKVVRSGLPTTSTLRRFQHEAEMLGQLQHPGIACIYEAGMAGIGSDGGVFGQRPFFAMELIRGKPLNLYAADNALDTRERLRLIAKVCDAMEHAHQEGVIHRDLKPGNILVDDGGQPKVLDFGVARATDAGVMTVTTQTGAGQLLGTVLYMSPEQVTGNSKQIDERSDVYALGVILYELLCGRPPHDVRDRSVPEAARIIRDEEPSRLSLIDTSFCGDIETIVAKACEKAKGRRYQSAAEFAADLRRHLRDEPIVARPPSRLYQLGKFTKRHKGLMAGLSTAFLAMTVGLIGTTWGVLEAARQRDEAIAASNEAKAVSRFLREMLASVDPEQAQGETVTVREVLDEASRSLEDSLADHPRVRAAIHETIGVTYQSLGEYEDAEPHLRTALELRRVSVGAHSVEVASNLNDLATLLYMKGDYEQAESLFREALQMRRSLLGFRHKDVATTLNDLGALLYAIRDIDGAEQLLSEALSVRRAVHQGDSADLVTSLSNVASIVEIQGDVVAAEPLYREALAMAQRLHGDEHRDVAYVQNNLARLLESKGDYEDAERFYRATLATRRKLLGDDHPEVATVLNNVANFHRLRGNLAKAESLAGEGLRIRRAALSASHPHLARSLRLLGQIALQRERPSEAETYLRECLEIRQEQLPEDHYLIADTESALGESIAKQGRLAEAKPLLLESYEPVRDKYGPKGTRTIAALNRIVSLYESLGEAQPAAAWRQRLTESSVEENEQAGDGSD